MHSRGIVGEEIVAVRPGGIPGQAARGRADGRPVQAAR